MLGAIIGDIAGSYYEVKEVLAKISKSKIPYEERIEILNPSMPLFGPNSSYTDDTVLTVALMDCLLNNGDYELYLRKYGLQECLLGTDIHGRSRFGEGFVKWLHANEQGNSFGNGSAMRVSPIGLWFDTIEEVLAETTKATIPSHNHVESINAAQATASAIYYAKKKYSKEKIKMLLEKEFGYDLNLDLDDLQHNYVFTSKAIDSVPQALYVFLISDNFEDAIRKAISIGGDTDTIAAITGSISEAYYGIPEEISSQVWHYLTPEYSNVIDTFGKALIKRNHL